MLDLSLKLTDIMQLMPSNDGRPYPNKLLPVTNVTSNKTYLVNKDHIIGISIRNKIKETAAPNEFPLEGPILYEGELCYVIDIILPNGVITYATKDPDEFKTMAMLCAINADIETIPSPEPSEEAMKLLQLTGSREYIGSLMSKIVYPPETGYLSLINVMDVGYPNESPNIFINRDKILFIKIYNTLVEHENGVDFLATVVTTNGQKFTLAFKADTDLKIYSYWYISQCFLVNESDDGGGDPIIGPGPIIEPDPM